MSTRMTKIQEILETNLKGLNLEGMRVYPIWKKWEELVGTAVANRSQPDFVRGSTLVVSVTNSVWMQELKFQEPTLLQQIAKAGLDPPIQSIQFRLRHL